MKAQGDEKFQKEFLNDVSKSKQFFSGHLVTTRGNCLKKYLLKFSRETKFNIVNYFSVLGCISLHLFQ